MTSRTIINETNKAGKESQHYLIVFDDNTYSVAERKLVMCQDDELKLGTKVKVRNGQKSHVGNLTNIGLKHDLERVAALQFGKKMAVDEKVTKTSKRKTDAREDAVPKLSKRKHMDLGAESLSESDLSEDEREKENDKLLSLFSSLGEKPIANIPIKKANCECLVQVENLNREIKLLKDKMLDIDKSVKLLKQKAEGTSDKPGMVVPSPPSTPNATKSDVEGCTAGSSFINIEHDGFNLMTVKAPIKDPKKNALRLLDKLFTTDELSQGILFASKRSGKKQLDQNRVQKMFEVLHANYGRDKVQRVHQHIVDACNQKCRDCARKLANKLERPLENDCNEID